MIDPPSATPVQPDSDLAEALRLLGKSEFLLAVHDASFPGVPGEDAGRGSPYGTGALALARFARELGFSGLLLGPQGQTSPVNASPYDGTLFSRNFLSLDIAALARDPVLAGLFPEAGWRRAVAGNPRPDACRVAYAYSFAAHAGLLPEIHGRYTAARERGEPWATALAAELAAFRHANPWLRDDALYEALSLEHGHLPWRQWPREGEGGLDWLLPAPPADAAAACARRRAELECRHAPLLERHALIQFLLQRQHLAFREQLRGLGLKLYGDVQVGFSQADTWSRQALLLRDYFMGAPPSRTNLEGQPWSYQVLDPAGYLDAEGGPGPVLAFIAERLGKMLAEFDGLRLDHPHGLVCPWVYRADDPDPLRAVQNGARLFAAPDLPDHPRLARHAIARPAQLNRARPRYADDWERELDADQVDRYALIVDALMQQAREHGRRREDILCEVLSTEPLPLQRVRERHGLGRFRVTQKADMDNPGDVYRGENARVEDWIMVGNHDTPSIWRLARLWQGQEAGRRQADYLAGRLRPAEPAPLARLLAADPRRLAQAKVAELFLSPARHVMLFFADLFGIEDTYNVPGTVNADNWTLRVPPDFAAAQVRDRRRGDALNLHAALALALRARPELGAAALIARLEAKAGWRIDSPDNA